MPDAELVAVVDTDLPRARAAADEFGGRPLSDCGRLAGDIDAAVVAVPTERHAEVGLALLEMGADLLMEKPIAPDLASADALIEKARSRGKILQIGHLERYNPIVEAAQALSWLPLFFEVHRTSPFTPRSLDIDVVLDLMIHDLEIVLSMVDSTIDRMEATGVPVLSPKADIGSVRLVFHNGCVANLTASRISSHRIRKLRFFQPRQYVSVDYDLQEGHVVGVSNDSKIERRAITVEKGEPLDRQASAFLDAVRNRSAPRVPGEAGRAALEVALRIVDGMGQHSRVVAETIAAGQR
jgi:predicted dehydrogenase